MGSSHHVFLSPRVQLNLHIPKTSMWLLDVRSPRLDVECRGEDRQGALKRKQLIVISTFSFGVNIGSTQPLDKMY